MTTFCGTFRYQAPEISSGKSYDARVDVWSAGVVLLEYCLVSEDFASLHSPINSEGELTPAAVINLINRIRSDKQGFKGLLEEMLVEDPTNRAWARDCRKVVPPLSEMENSDFGEEAIAPVEAHSVPPTMAITTTLRPTSESLTRQDNDSQGQESISDPLDTTEASLSGSRSK